MVSGLCLVVLGVAPLVDVLGNVDGAEVGHLGMVDGVEALVPVDSAEVGQLSLVVEV